jgi:hypothetical protein
MYEIIPQRLYQSGLPISLVEVIAKDIDTIINVGHEELPWLTAWKLYWLDKFNPDNIRQPLYFHAALMDCPNGLDEVACNLTILNADLLLKATDRKILVHCEAGAYRSIHVCAGIVAKNTLCPGATAFQIVDRRTGHTNPRSSLGLAGWKEHAKSWDWS